MPTQRTFFFENLLQRLLIVFLSHTFFKIICIKIIIIFFRTFILIQDMSQSVKSNGCELLRKAPLFFSFSSSFLCILMVQIFYIHHHHHLNHSHNHLSLSSHDPSSFHENYYEKPSHFFHSHHRFSCYAHGHHYFHSQRNHYSCQSYNFWRRLFLNCHHLELCHFFFSHHPRIHHYHRQHHPHIPRHCLHIHRHRIHHNLSPCSLECSLSDHLQ